MEEGEGEGDRWKEGRGKGEHGAGYGKDRGRGTDTESGRSPGEVAVSHEKEHLTRVGDPSLLPPVREWSTLCIPGRCPSPPDQGYPP